MTITLTEFVIQYPWISFGLSWPIALVLIYGAWATATTLENIMHLISQLFNATCNTFVLTIRGYVPQSKESNPESNNSENQ